MALIKSISGIRGTIGGSPNDNISPINIVEITSAFASYLNKYSKCKSNKVKLVVGRDARVSGEMINMIAVGTLIAMGVDVVDIGLSTTPTVEIAVTDLNANGGIIITASHNPKNWNALKLLNCEGEFLSDKDIKNVLSIAEQRNFIFAKINELGKYYKDDSFIKKHIEKVINLPLVDVDAIRKAKFRVVVDGINSTGGFVIPLLLKALGVNKIYELNCEPNGDFSHNPEPIPDNLYDISEKVVKSKANLGFVVDPDVDRLAIVSEDGEMFGEEYTLVAVADYILKNKKGNTVSNLSSTRALQDITEKAGGEYFASPVGEVNVVKMMKEKNAVIGGEGNGGVIYPDLHYGRDALAGVALFLTYLAKSGKTCSALKYTYPKYVISKNRIELSSEIDIDKIFSKIKKRYKKHPVDTSDGIKIMFEKEWVHLRKSNTEEIIRIYSESDSIVKAECLANKIIGDIKEFMRDISEQD